MWPIECKDAGYIGSARDLATLRVPAIDPALVPAIGNVRAGIRLRLATLGKAVWGKLPIGSLPLYLVGTDDTPFQLYEQLLANTVAVVLRPAGDRPAWHEIVADRPVRPLGFDDDEALLPAEPRAFQGYRLLREYFAFPQRFRFADLHGLARAAARAGDLRELEVVVLLDRADPRLLNNIDARNFVPFCTPAVNLFPKTCDRIHLDPTENRYHVVPDRTRPLDFEIHSVSAVTGHGGADQPEQEFRPLYGTDDFARRGQDQRYFVPERRPRKLPESRAGGVRSAYVGSELFLTLVDGDRPPHDPALKQLSVRALCSNRDLPLSMPVGLRETDFTLDSGAFVQGARCLGRPTPPRPPVADGELAWRLIDHLSLNYLSLVDAGPQGAVALRELLGLYADLGERTDQKQIQGVRSVHSGPVVRRLPTAGPLAFGRGLHIDVTCDENEFQGSSVYLLGAVLEQFFARYVSVNSFTETVLHTVERGEIARWPPRIGTRHLL
jgi:type VI secretion system protein ImpG